jgi:chain length determinant protein tyrosine kinase EpsG
MNSLTSASGQGSLVEAAAGMRSEASIGKLLQDAGKIKPKDIERVLELQKSENLRFGEAAKKLGLVTDDDIQHALSHQFQYPVISTAEASLSPELTAATAPYSKEAEALRSVRSELMLRWFRDGRKALAIGEASAGEGASYLAANLAVLFAQLGRKVLLIDANMRQPRQQTIFNLDNSAGLSEILAERVPSVQVRTIKAFPTLSVLPAGSPPPNPAELLARSSLDALLSGLETSYDIILLDTAPSQLSSDFQQVVARVGGILLATRRNVSRLAPLTSMKEKINFTGAQIVGAVVLD